jgi:ribose 5-phosphate isomerase B
MMIYIGSDHAGFNLKSDLVVFIRESLKLDIEDMGTHSKESVDYPDFAKAVCDKVLANGGLGIVICSTGIGISIAANKIKGIRAALCTEEYSAVMSRMHNNANVLALGANVLGTELAKSIVKSFFSGNFEAGRHSRRIEKIAKLEC